MRLCSLAALLLFYASISATAYVQGKKSAPEGQDITIPFLVNATLTKIGGFYGIRKLRQVIPEKELAAMSATLRNNRVEYEERLYDVGKALQIAYSSLTDNTKWPELCRTEVPSMVKSVLNDLLFSTRAEKNFSMFLPVYKMVLPYLPDAVVEHWQRNCPCQANFWARNHTADQEEWQKEALANKTHKWLSPYYTPLLGVPGAFERLIHIDDNESLSVSEKEEQMVDFLSGLPKEVKTKLPLASIFHDNYEEDAKRLLNEIYYRRDTPLSRKWFEIANLVHVLPNPNVLFYVNVTLTGLDGTYSHQQLQQVLSASELAAIDAIRANASIPNKERLYAVGNVLQLAYASDVNISRRATWPIPPGTEELPNAVQLAIKELLFAPRKEPYTFVFAYEEAVESYLPGGSQAKRWQRECPCQADFWARYYSAHQGWAQKKKSNNENVNMPQLPSRRSEVTSVASDGLPMQSWDMRPDAYIYRPFHTKPTPQTLEQQG